MISLEEIQQTLNCSGTGALPQRFQRQLVFIAEVDKMKSIVRRTLLTDGSRQENDAEHSWHLALMAIILEEYAAEPVNLGRVLAMVTVHDLIEIYAGDTFAFDIDANQDKSEREAAAADRLFGLLAGEQGREEEELYAAVVAAIHGSVKVGCTGCGYCQPCPKGINIPKIFQAYTYLNVYGLKDLAKNTWNGYLTNEKNPGVSPSECINCGYCEKKCPQHLKVRELLK